MSGGPRTTVGTTDSGLWVRRYGLPGNEQAERQQAEQAGKHELTERGKAYGEQAVRLVCFPHAGGSASYFHPLSRSLAPAIDVLAVQYPGRQDRYREPCIDDIPRLADRIYQALLPFLDRPFAFFGHSMGAILAFEVARRCESAMTAWPSRLFVSGRRAPSRHRDEKVHLADDAGLVRELLAVGGTDRRLAADPELLATVLPAVRSDYRAAETYVFAPGPPLTCPITAFTGESDPKATVAEVRDWRAHSTGGFTLRVFPGGHFFIEEYRDDIAEIITGTLRPASR